MRSSKLKVAMDPAVKEAYDALPPDIKPIVAPFLAVRCAADRVVIVPDTPEGWEQLSGGEWRSEKGLVLPEHIKESLKAVQEATIVAIGPGRWLDSKGREAPEFSIGEHIVFETYGWDKMEWGERVVLAGKVHNIICAAPQEPE